MLQVLLRGFRRTTALRHSCRWVSSFHVEGETVSGKENGVSGGNDDLEDKPATKSLVNEMLAQQRKQMPHLSSQPVDTETKSNSSTDGSTPLQEFLSDKPLFTGEATGAATTGKTEHHHRHTATSPQENLFDVFQVPDFAPEKAERGPNAFDEAAYQQYMEIAETTLSLSDSNKLLKIHTKRPIGKELAKPVFDWFRLNEPAVPYDLPTFERALKEGVTVLDPVTASERDGTFRKEIELQRGKFLETLGFEEKQLVLATNVIYRISNLCAKHAKGLPVEVLWAKAKEGGFQSRDLLHNLLYLSSTFLTGSARSRAKRKSKYAHLTGITSILDILNTDDKINSEEEEDVVDLTDEIAIYRDLLYNPTEQSINVRIRLLVSQGKAKEAERLLDEISSAQAELRLRAYSPVLRLYLELGDLSSALALFRKMQTRPSVNLDTETYVHLISGIARHGRFQPSAQPIEGATELGYSHSSGPGLLDEIIEDLSKEMIEISEASAKKLYNALACGFPNSGLEETASLAPLKLNHEPSTKQELLANRVRIDPSTGSCPRSGVKLRLIQLKEEEKKKLMDGVISLAKSRHREQRSKNKIPTSLRRSNETAEAHLREFYRYLDQRDGEPFTVICDGANLGYFSQNFEDGGFSYHQVKFMVDTLEKMGENPLVVIPYKYTRDWFHTSMAGFVGFRKQVLTPEEIAIRNELIFRDRILVVPPSMLDDFYWILASVSSQLQARKGRDLNVAPGNPKGRWPGTRPVLLTNDQMRDHHIEMLEPMLFRRWYSNFIVNYNFAAFVNGKCTHPQVGFSPADFFSKEIQGNRDEKGSMVWHFPLCDKENEWFCLRVPAKELTE